MTEGDLIDAGLSYYLNQGSPSVLTDSKTRRKAWFFTVQTAKRLWNSAPNWFKKGDGQVQLASGVGTMPDDFAQMGTQAGVYLANQKYRRIAYREPMWMKLQISQSPQFGTPWAYTLYHSTPSVTSQGLQEILAWPQDNSLLDVFAYDRKMVELVDKPLALFATVNPAAGLLSGTYTYVVTYETLRGETEYGAISNAVSPALEQVDLSDIPRWWGRTVTSRKIYRNNAASGNPNEYFLVTTLADNTTTIFTDNVADGALGAAAPLPAAGVSGLEFFPEDFHESALFEGLQYYLGRGQGDRRDARFFQEWTRSVQRQWEETQQGQNEVKAFPAFPGTGRGGGVWSRHTPPS